MSRSIDWMGGEPPESWEVFKLKHVLREETKDIGADVPAGAISFGEVVFKKFDNDETLATYRTVRKGQFLINPLNLNYDLKSLRIGLSRIDCRVSPAYIVATHDAQRATSEYLRWALRVFDVQHIKTLGAGVRQTVKFEDIGDCRIALPDLDAQKAIDTHLDRATTRIDTLIAKKTRFIELLREKRQALITHAVTKGLDAGAPMKDSGVEWLGEVPRHWRVAQLRRITMSRCDGPFGSGLKSSNYTQAGARVIRLQNIGTGQFKVENAVYVGTTYWQNALGGGHEVLPGDLLMAGLGDDNNPLGRSCVAPQGISPALVKADCYRFRLTSGVEPKYFALLLSATARQECGFLANGATRDRLNLSLASSRVVGIPPLNEQNQIVAHLDHTTSRMDSLIAKTERSVELLREHRTALITAAVTGKIDLREAS